MKNCDICFTTDQMIRNGEVDLKAREEEIRFIKLQMTEEKRNLGLMRKVVPDKRSLEQELVTMQIQVINYVTHIRNIVM